MTTRSKRLIGAVADAQTSVVKTPSAHSCAQWEMNHFNNTNEAHEEDIWVLGFFEGVSFMHAMANPGRALLTQFTNPPGVIGYINSYCSSSEYHNKGLMEALVAFTGYAAGFMSGNSTQPYGNAPLTTPQPTPSTQPQVQYGPCSQPDENNLQSHGCYRNRDGDTVHSPSTTYDGKPALGATALCRDGTSSFSQHRSGTCSHHGGIAR
jgi:hypothetical protein